MEKKSTAEPAEATEFFLDKVKKHKSFYGNGPLFGFDPPGMETRG
jgi:hypothetical protein